MKQISKYIFVVTIAVYTLIFLLFHFLKQNPVETFTIVYISTSAFFLLICWQVFQIDVSKKLFYLLLAVGILIRIIFISLQPIGSDDVYRYMWDGKVQANGLNPYSFSPNDEKLSYLHTDLLPNAVNFPTMKTIYFPLSQWLFYSGYLLSGENVWGYKFLLLIFEIMTVGIILLLLKKLKLPEKFSLFYLLCPLPIIQFALDAHLDGFGLPLLLLAIYFYLDERKIPSLIFLGLSLSIKPVGLLLMPILFFNEKGIAAKTKVMLIPFAAFFIQFIPYIFTSNPFEMFFIYAKNWTFNGVVFTILNSFIKNNQTSRMICGAMLVLSLLPIIFGKKDFLGKIYFSVILLMIFSPVVHPWYVAWLVILLPIIPKWSGIVYASLSSLTAFTILNYQLNGIWKEYSLVLILEYLPVLLLLFAELRGKRITIS